MVDEQNIRKILCRDLEFLPQVASELLEMGGNIGVWLFFGELGAGKTTLIKALCRQLKCLDEPSSPTFNLINEYLTEDSKPVFHFDFYRIKNEVEAYDIGADEYFDSGYYCFIEWPNEIKSLWPQQYMSVNISVDSDGVRTIEAKKHD